MATKLYFSQNEFNNVENLATEAIAMNGLTNKMEQLNVTNNLKGDHSPLKSDHKGANTPNHCDEHSDDDFQDESSLFIGDLSRTMTEEILKQTFERYGEVDSVDIKRDKVTKNNLGYGFVKFTKRQDAEVAKEKLHGAEVAGRQIRIGWAQKNTNLFVGDLDERIGNDDLRKIFRQFGPIYEEDTFVKRNKYGFVKFKHRVHAEKAKQQLDGKHLTIPSINEQTERPIRIGWGDANAQRNCVHVQFDVASAEQQNISEDDFIAHFKMFGHVVKVSLPRYVDRRLKGYGFIHFEENDNGEESAARAITTLNNTLIRNVMIQCNFGKRQNIKQKRRAMLHNNFEEYRFNYMSQLGEITNIQQFGLAPTRGLYQQQMYGSNLSAPFMTQMNVPCDIRQSISLQPNTSAVKPLNTMPPPGPMGSYLPQQGQVPDFAKMSNSHPNMVRSHIENLPPSPPPIPSPMMNAAMMGTMNESNISLPPISMGAPMMIPSPPMQPTTSPPPPNANLPNINLWNNYNQFSANMQNHLPNAPHHPNMQPTMPSISPNMQPTIHSISPNMQPIMPSISPNMQPIMPSISPNMQPMMPSISPNMQPILSSISPNMQPIIPNMQSTMPSISSNMQPTMPSISPNMRPTMPSISPNMQPMSSSSISPNIQPVMSSISSNMQSTISSISPNMQPTMPVLMNNQGPPQFFAGVYRQ